MTNRFALVAIVLLTCASCGRDSSTKPLAQDQAPHDVALNAEQIREKYQSLMIAGKAHYENGSGAQAVQSFERAVLLLPGELPARLNLARACLLSQENEKALKNARIALSMDSRNVAALYLCGLSSLRLEKGAEAISYLERACQLDPSSSTMRFQLANALRLNNEITRANDELRNVLQLDPDNWSAYFQLAAEARRAGDTELSNQYMLDYQRLIKAVPESSRSPDELENCIYTVPEVPSGVHQPPIEATQVRFAEQVTPTVPDTKKSIVAIAMLPIDSSGQQNFLAVDAKGDIRLVHSHAGGMQIAAGTLLTIDPAVSWQGRAADYDNDGLTDVFVFSSKAVFLLKQEANSSFKDVAATAGINSPEGADQGLRDALWLDYDHDGDVDLLVVNQSGRLKLWLNQGNGKFVDETDAAGIPADLDGVTSVAAADMNDDEAIDVVLALSAGLPVRQLSNDGLGIFSLQKSDLPWPSGAICIVDDLDNDLKRDVVIANDHELYIVYADGRRTSIPIDNLAIAQVHFIDYDNDGWLDLLVAGRAPDELSAAGRLRLFRNVGAAPWQDVTEQVGLNEFRVDSKQAVQTADLDHDGDTDVAATDANGSGVVLLNEGGQSHGQLKLRLRGTRSNRSGLGTIVEIRSGSFRLSRTVTRFPIEIGVADLKQLDSVKTIWPNGIVKNDIWVNPKEILSIEEPFVSAGSCPYLYAWDGNSFQFVTDILGSSPLGLSLRKGVFVPADTSEYVWLGGEQAMGRDGDGFAIQITDELREILYLDQVELHIVDHPPNTEAHPTSKLQPPPFVVGDIWVLEKQHKLKHAIDDGGREWTAQLQEIDKQRSGPSLLRRPQLRGLAKQHSLVLDFGPLDVSEPLVLALTGWLQWGDASVNLAASQDSDLPNPWPQLEAWTGDRWEEVNVIVGLPAGKSKAILVDLNDALPPGTERLRLTAAYEVYWDRISLFQKSRQEAVTTLLPIIEANLQLRGFPRQIRPDARGPIIPDTTHISPTAPWRMLPMGWCTRYGEISELITAKDDRLAIFNGGDGAIIKFAGELPELKDGWHRDFFVLVDGWDKDSDYNVACGNRVEPLPYHGMDDQHYGALPEKRKSEWENRYNTRWVGLRLQ